MSQTAQTKPGQGRPGQGRPGGGRPARPVQYGGGRPGQANRRPRREPVEEIWIPKTVLGQKVNSGEITSIEDGIKKLSSLSSQERKEPKTYLWMKYPQSISFLTMLLVPPLEIPRMPS